jgi:hypothetical protein
MPSDELDELRQKAAHSRRQARTLPGDEASGRLNDYAAELEAQARAIDLGRA